MAMSKKHKGLELNQLKIIEISDIPDMSRPTPYRELAEKVPIGKAIVVTDEEINIDSVRTGIQRLQKNGEFKDIVMKQRTVDGLRHLFIMKPRSKTTY
jgi:hypothetical protein